MSVSSNSRKNTLVMTVDCFQAKLLVVTIGIVDGSEVSQLQVAFLDKSLEVVVV